MRIRVYSLSTAIFALALLTGCVGEPQTFYIAEPVVPEHRVAVRAPVRSSPTIIAPTLSADQKQRLFQDFQQLQGANNQAAVATELTP